MIQTKVVATLFEMKFIALPLQGAYCIEIERLPDERGYFGRTFCKSEFARHGLSPHLEQCSVSFNQRKYTLRGMHFQIEPFEEAKLVCCIQGAVYDVLIDMRKESPTFLQWVALELTAENEKLLYVPEGFAHGFQTLEDKTKVFYQISARYHPLSARGVRFDDPIFSIPWPNTADITISPKDLSYPFYEEHPLHRERI